MSNEKKPVSFRIPLFVDKFLEKKSLELSYKRGKKINKTDLLVEAAINYFQIKESKNGTKRKKG